MSGSWVQHLETAERFAVAAIRERNGRGRLDVLVAAKPFPLRTGRHRLFYGGHERLITVTVSSLENPFLFVSAEMSRRD